MPRKFYTIFILPHAHARFRKIHVSRNFLIGAAVGALAIVALSLAAPHLVLRARAQASYLAVLEGENQKLRRENARFEASLSRIGDQVNTIESVAGRLAAAVGLERLAPRPAGGGPEESLVESTAVQAMLDEELDALARRASGLDASFEEIGQVVEQRLQVLAATPSILPVEGGYSDGYGWRQDPFSGEREFHKGVDIVAPSGTAVLATADGLVTTAARTTGYGKLVQLSHGFGLNTRYGHLSEIRVRPGARVKKGDVIGLVGSTGRSSGPHLHYEVMRAGRAVDPRQYLSDKLF
jgi:murein DD-endopeptidase MepM/ murein hydrolase activator NlpD